MEYQKYINLGFARINTHDTVVYRATGNQGFYLTQDINEKMTVCVQGDELDKPKLYILRKDSSTYHIINIKEEVVESLFSKPSVVCNEINLQ